MQKDGAPTTHESEIGAANNVVPVLAVAMTQRPYEAAQFQLRLRVSGFHPSHSFTALLRG